jgi:hypothetical protein
MTTEEIAAALMCPLVCNQHVTKQPDEAQRRNTIERLMWRTQDHGKQEQAEAKASRDLKIERAGLPDWRECRENGSPLPSMHNARIGINALGVECTYDKYDNELLFGSAATT